MPCCLGVLLFGFLDGYIAAGIWRACASYNWCFVCTGIPVFTLGDAYIFAFTCCAYQHNSLLLAVARTTDVPGGTAPYGPICNVCINPAIFCPYYHPWNTNQTLDGKHRHCKRVYLLDATSLCLYYQPM